MKKVTDSPKRKDDSRTPEETIKSDEEVINVPDPGVIPEEQGENTVKITFIGRD